MKKPFALRFAAALAAAVFCLGAALPGGAVYDMPVALSAEDESVYLYNMDTGEALLDQNSTVSRYVASTTKMMTALLLLESGADLNTTITVPERLTQEFADIQQYNGADMKLKIGENIRLIDLLYGLLLPSANDAASTIADYLTNGDIPAFVGQMNARAAALGCTGTTFTCPHGLYDAGNVSTAQDLAKIAAACNANETYMQIANTTSYMVPADNMNTEEREIVSSNPMIDPESPYYNAAVSGMKTGFTTLAGRCFVTTAEHEGHRYMLVILGAKKEKKDETSYIYTETNQILNWAFSRYSDVLLLDPQKPAATVTLTGCDEATEISLYPAEGVTQNIYADAKITTEDTVDTSIAAPVKAGETFGTITVYVDGAAVGTVSLVAGADYQAAVLKGGLNALALLPVLALLLCVLAAVTVAAGRRRTPAMRQTESPAPRRTIRSARPESGARHYGRRR